MTIQRTRSYMWMAPVKNSGQVIRMLIDKLRNDTEKQESVFDTFCKESGWERTEDMICDWVENVLCKVSKWNHAYTNRVSRKEREIQIEVARQTFLMHNAERIKADGYTKHTYALSHVQAHSMPKEVLDLLIDITDMNIWIDLLCTDEFDGKKCGSMYYDKVIVYDELLYASRNIIELEIAFYFSDWIKRGWMYKEIINAKEAIFLTKIGTKHFKLEQREEKICFHNFEENIVIEMDGLGLYQAKGDILGTLHSLLTRLWTYPDDMYKCLGILCDILLPSHQELAKLLKSDDIIMALSMPGPRLNEPGFGWLPATLHGTYKEGIGLPRFLKAEVMGDVKAYYSPDGERY